MRSSSDFSGCSWKSRIALAASITEPPPTATRRSGRARLSRVTPAWIVASDGSGSTSLKTCTCRVRSLDRSRSTTPRRSLSASVTMTAASHSTSRKFSSAPALKNVLAGTRNHCGGVRRWETVLMLSSWV